MLEMIRELPVGSSCVFGAERLYSARVQASNEGLKLGRRYKTSTNREARTITVTRVE